MAHQIFKNALILSTTQVVSRILSFTFFLIIARYFGSEYFGKYYYVYTLIFLLTFISDSGLSAFIVREIAKAKQQVGHLLIHSVIIRIFLSSDIVFLPRITGNPSSLPCFRTSFDNHYMMVAHHIKFIAGLFRAVSRLTNNIEWSFFGTFF